MIGNKEKIAMRQNSGRMLFQAGMSLLEVLIGILIFAIGIMALTQLQGSLARSAGDANTRTVAINIAEQVIERQRGFSRITTDPAGIEYAYADIATAPKYTVARGDLSFNVEITVTVTGTTALPAVHHHRTPGGGRFGFQTDDGKSRLGPRDREGARVHDR